MRQLKDFIIDKDFQLKDAGLVAASAAAQVGGSNRILDLGTGRVDGRVIIDLTAVEVASGDEGYRIIAQVSSSSTFASDVWNASALLLGDSTVSLESADTLVGRRELPFLNEINGTTFRYFRLFTHVVGMIATGINYTAWAVLKP